ncbi:MAG: 2-amino-4-hydroxy-6-hydroxymethyldihydropteridine diphosphokinase [Prevotella sp.]|nr:2-amino-4-hydroxy-6-hydroxymethyldihydropteridine diphosphokinase [Prevotella sp.]
MCHTVYLGLGSNLGDKRRNIRRAIRKIKELIGAVERQSALHVSQPWGFNSKNTFVNAVVRCRTSLSPHELLSATQDIEREIGKTVRSRKNSDGRLLDGETYHDRLIDIDILLYDDITLNEPDLIIPHPLMQERDFVMIPLAEVQEEPSDQPSPGS